MASSKYRIPFAICICLSTALPACALARSKESPPSGAASPAPVAPPATGDSDTSTTPQTAPSEQRLRQVIRKAELDVDVASPSDALRRAREIAERRGGFVANSSSSNVSSRDNEPESVLLVLRVPADLFSEVLSELHKLSHGRVAEQVGADDVSEECLDLDARLKTQRALEQQFLEILKHADKVEDLLRVQHEIASVRAEIERMEGRRRFLEREVALATITLTLHREKPLVRASFRDLGEAARDGAADAVNNAGQLIAGSLRWLGAALPTLIFMGPPAWFLAKLIRRRRKAVLPAAVGSGAQ